MSADDDTDPLGPTGLADEPKSTAARSPSQQRMHDDVRGALFDGKKLASREYEPGEVLGGRYRIVGQLGRGGMGVVYRADDLVLGESVAIKFLPAEVAERPDYIERFVREVRTARKVTHGNVCRVHDIGEVDGRRFLSMEYVDGEDLASLLRRIGRLDHDKAVELSHQLCAGLAALHDRDIIHRDLKPANVMIDGSGHLKLADFGLAALVDEFGKEEIRDGTPAYQAPEQARGEAVTKASDIYALGLILDEMFSGSSRSRRASSKTASETSRARVDPEIAELIDRCLQDDPAKRPGSAREAALALPGGDPLARALAQGQLLSADAVANAPTAGALRPSVAWGIAAAVLIFVMTVAVLQTRSSPTALVPPLDVAVLEHRANEHLETLVEEPPKARTVFAAYDREAGERVVDDPSAREDPLFDPFRLVIRVSKKRITAQGSQITLDDPPAVMPGTTTLTVDGQGALRGLLIVPREDDPAVLAEAPPDWSPALVATGFDPATLQPSTPSRAPPTNVDEVAAWTTADGGGRIEVGARGDDVVWLTVEREDTPEDTADEDDLPWVVQAVMIAFRAVFVVIVLIAFPVAAVRTLRDGGSDFTGARRLAYGYLALSVVTHITASPVSGVHASNDMILSTIGGAALAAVGYVVIEPFVRRRMPRALVGWNRLLRGRFSDPLVGRELLVGLALGVALAGGIGVLASFGGGMTIEPETLLGGRRATSILWSSMLFGPSTAMLLLAVLLVIQWRVKNRWVAGGPGGARGRAQLAVLRQRRRGCAVCRSGRVRRTLRPARGRGRRDGLATGARRAFDERQPCFAVARHVAVLPRGARGPHGLGQLQGRSTCARSEVGAAVSARKSWRCSTMTLSRRSLPIAAPCDASWEDMQPDGARRFCGHCDEYVHDLSVMSEPEARSFLQSLNGREACLRYRSDAAGRVRFAVPAPLGAAVLVATALLLAACAGWDAEEPLSLPDAELCRDEVGYVTTCDDGRDAIPDERPSADRPAPEQRSASRDDILDDEGIFMGALLPAVVPHGPIHAPVPDIKRVDPTPARDGLGAQEVPSTTGEVSMHVEAFRRSGMRPTQKAGRRRARRKRAP